MSFFKSGAEGIQLYEHWLLHFLLTIITGEPKVSMKPTATQKWAKNKRAGSGAVILFNWPLRVAKGGESLKKVTKKTNAIRSIRFFLGNLAWK